MIIEPDVKPFVWDDFTRTPDLIAAGEAATLSALAEIRQVIKEAESDSAGVMRV